MNGDQSQYVLVSSPGMGDIAEAIRSALIQKGVNFPHYQVEYLTFKNGEILAHIPHTVRQQRVFFLHPLQYPDPNIELMKLLIAGDAMSRANVADITLVVPYMPYMRQDRKDRPRVPITMRLIANLIEANPKITGLITADLHTEQLEGFFSISVDNLSSANLFADSIRTDFGDTLGQTVVVAPDFGSAKRARKFAERLGDLPVAIIEKRRPEANVAEVLSIIGEPVAGKRVVIYDDMIDTGGTILSVMKALKEAGALDVRIYATHGIFSGDAEARFAAGGFPVTVTDSIPRDEAYLEANPWLTQASLVPLLADAIHQASLVGGSISRLSD